MWDRRFRLSIPCPTRRRIPASATITNYDNGRDPRSSIRRLSMRSLCLRPHTPPQEINFSSPVTTPARFTTKWSRPTATRAPAPRPCTRSLPTCPSRSSRNAANWPTSLTSSRASPSPSTATAAAPSASSPSTSCPASSRAHEWDLIERGLAQRVTALNLYLQDIYGQQRILKDRIVPRNLVYSCKHFRREMVGLAVPRDIYIHISGIDLVRDSRTGEYLVLEDNARSPSGISYVLENRLVMRRTFPRAFELSKSCPSITTRPNSCRSCAAFLRAPPTAPSSSSSRPAFITAPTSNTASSPRRWASSSSKAAISWSPTTCVYMKTIHGLTRVDVIYRRVDDDFLDPLAFRADSLVGVPGLMNAYRAGNIALANAVGTGVADDKAIYAYVPQFIRYYLGEDPILHNVETYLCSDPNQLSYVLDHLPELVVKAVGESGGYGMLMGPASDKKTIADFRERLIADPRNYIAQPVIPLSRCPAFDPVTGAMSPRHVDLRPYCLYDGEKVTIVPGGLTRVALQRARWSSIRHRVEAAKIPGFSEVTNNDALTHCRFALLDRPLHGARR